jgi:hypothetical protein
MNGSLIDSDGVVGVLVSGDDKKRRYCVVGTKS